MKALGFKGRTIRYSGGGGSGLVAVFMSSIKFEEKFLFHFVAAHHNALGAIKICPVIINGPSLIYWTEVSIFVPPI